MGCCGGDREKHGAIKAEQKWEYINLDDFKSNSCLTPFAYGYLWVMLIVSISVYCVDTFTAVNLLVFDRWSGQIKPEIPLRISRWIFAGCIILSFFLLFYRWLRAIRVMKQGGVAKSYLDPLAVRIQSIRIGPEGRGWKRFLVFAELTKSRKGADYVALFSYYSFEAWLRIVFAEGPRQVINALTLYSVMRLNLLPQGEHAATQGHTPVVQFFVNVGLLADSNKLQAVILFGMLWTLIIWVISAISLMISVILYLIFLWHHIPSSDKGLSGYCRRKVDARMKRIVRAKVDKALRKEQRRRARQEGKANGDFKRQPTLPDLESADGDSLLPVSRQTTFATLSEDKSKLPLHRTSDDSLAPSPQADTSDPIGRPSPPQRGMTQSSDASWTSYSSKVPLMNGAADMGHDLAQTPRSASPSPWNTRAPPSRSMTGLSQQSQQSQRPFSPMSTTGPIARPGTAQGLPNTPGTYQMEPLPRSASSMSSHTNEAVGMYQSDSAPIPPLPQGRSTSANQQRPFPLQMPSSSSPGPAWPPSATRSPEDLHSHQTPQSSTNPYFPPMLSSGGRYSPAPSYRPQYPYAPPPIRSYAPVELPAGQSVTPPRPQLPRLDTSDGSNTSPAYIAFSPSAQTLASSGPERNFARPTVMTESSCYPSRQTAQSSQPAYPPSRFGAQNSAPKHDSVADILDRY